MDVTLQARKRVVFDLVIGNETLKGFEIVSKWNGMLELKGEGGITMIVDDSLSESPFQNLFNDVFGMPDTPWKMKVLKASPEIITKLYQAGLMPEKN